MIVTALKPVTVICNDMFVYSSNFTNVVIENGSYSKVYVSNIKQIKILLVKSVDNSTINLHCVDKNYDSMI